MKLADGKGELVPLFRDVQLQGAALERFPELAADLDGDGIHFVMAALARTVLAAAERGDETRARSVFDFLDGLLDRRDLDREIPNAIALSFVEPESLLRSAAGRRVWDAAPKRLRSLLVEDEPAGRAGP
jgi:hypothetical protein